MPRYALGIRRYAWHFSAAPVPADPGLLNAPAPRLAEMRLPADLQSEVAPMDCDVSVIVATRDAGPEFGFLLRKLRQQQGLGRIEIIAVDADSRDGTAELARSEGAIVIAAPSSDSRADNGHRLGAAAAGCPYLLFLAQDAFPIGDYWIHDMLRSITDRRRDGVAAICCAEYGDATCGQAPGNPPDRHPLSASEPRFANAVLLVERGAFAAIERAATDAGGSIAARLIEAGCDLATPPFPKVIRSRLDLKGSA